MELRVSFTHNAENTHSGPLSARFSTAMWPISLKTVIDTFCRSVAPTDDQHEPNRPMSYMIRGNDVAETNPFDETPFTKTDSLAVRGSDIISDAALKGAKRLYSELQRTGELDSISLSWFDSAIDLDRTGYKPETFYFLEVGPIVATVPDATWNSAFTMDLETAPKHKSTEWKDIASQFSLSPRAEKQGIPDKVSCMYSALEKATKRNDVSRAMHPRELRNHGPHVSNRAAERAYECLAQFDGVTGPDESAPAWEYVTETDTPVEGTEGSHA